MYSRLSIYHYIMVFILWSLLYCLICIFKSLLFFDSRVCLVFSSFFVEGFLEIFEVLRFSGGFCLISSVLIC